MLDLFDAKLSIRTGHGKRKVSPGGILQRPAAAPREQSPGRCLLRRDPFPLKSGGCVSWELCGGRAGWKSQGPDAAPVYWLVLAPPRELLHLTAPAVPVSAEGPTLPSVSLFEFPNNFERQMMVDFCLSLIPPLQVGKLSQDEIICPRRATS